MGSERSGSFWAFVRRSLSFGLSVILAFQTFIFSPGIARADTIPSINPITVTSGHEVDGVFYTKNQRPTIAATFTAGTNPINVGTAVLRNEGIPNPLTTTASSSGISYTPSVDLVENDSVNPDYAITVDVQDSIGNPATQVSASVIVDITKPSNPTIISPVTGLVSNVTTPTISGLAETNSTVNVYDGANPTPIATTTAVAGSYSVATLILSEASHVLTVTATDYAGNVSNISESVVYTVDTTLPTVNAGTNKIVNVPTLQDATVSDVSGIANYSWSKVSGLGTITFGTSTAEDTEISADTNGVYVLRLNVTDNAGNSNHADMNFTWDSAAPSVSINPIGSPSSVTTPTITGTATDVYSNIVSVDYRIDGGAWSSATATDSTFDSLSENYTLTTAALDDGSHTVEVRATNALGNIAVSDFVSRTFIVDTIDPAVSISSPVVAQVVTGSSMTIDWSASDANLAASPIDLAYSTNGVDYTDIATGLANTGSYIWSSVPVIDSSTVTIKVSVHDNASHIGLAVSDQFVVDRVAPGAPTGGITPASPTNDNTPTVTGAVDNNTVSVQVSVGSDSISVSPVANGYTAAFGTITDGTYSITAVAIDIHGNTSAATTIAAAYQIDHTAPTFISASQFPVGTTSNARSAISGTFSDAGSGLNNASIDLTINGWYSVPLSDVSVGDDGHFVYQAPHAFAEGTYSVDATISDNAGNISDVTEWSFTVSSAPTITSVTPSNINLTTDPVTVVGVVSADDLGTQTVEIYLDGQPFSTPQIAPVLISGTGFTTNITGAQLAELKAGTQGTHTLSAKRTGAFGNMTALGDAFSINVDTIAPTLNSVALSPVNNSNKNNATLSVVGEPNTTVNYSIDDASDPLTAAVTGTATLDAGGNATITGINVSALNDGDLTATVILSDEAGNVSAPMTDVRTKDTVLPTLSSVSIDSSNPDHTVAKVGDTITLSMTSLENITTPIVTITGQTAVVTGSGTSYSATHTMQSGDTEGTISFQISGYSDVNGNLGATVAAVTDSSAVLFDRTAPMIDSVSPTPSTNNSSAPVTARWTESGSGFATGPAGPARSMNLGLPVDTAWDGATATMSYTPVGGLLDNVYHVTATIQDRAGNIATTSWTFTTDNIAPTGDIHINSGAAYTNTTAVTLNLSATDNISMTGAKMAFSDNDSTYSAWEDYASTKSYSLPTGDGSKTVYAKYQDAATNASGSYSATIMLDQTVPTVALSSILTTSTNVSPLPVTATFSEGVTGFDLGDIVVGNGSAGNLSGTGTTYTFDVIPTDQGIVTVDVAENAAQDVANNGNTAATRLSRTYDSVAPVAAVTYSDPDRIVKVGDSLAVTATFNEPLEDFPLPQITISGANTVAAVNMTKITPTHYFYIHTVGIGDGEATVSFGTGTDLVGNVVAAVPAGGATFTVDNTAPVINATAPLSSNRVSGSAFVSFTDTESTSPECSIDNSVWVACSSGVTTLSSITGFDALSDGVFTLYLRDTDLAGNTGSDSEVGIIRDTTNPEIVVNSLSASNLNPARAKVGDTMTAVFTTDEALAVDPTVTFGTKTMTKSGQTGNQYTYTRLLDGSETEGSAVLSISAGDLAGNIGTDGSQTFTTDFTAPVTSDNATSAWTKNDVTVTLSVVETGSVPTTTLYSTDGSAPSITYTVPFTLSAADTYQLKYASIDSAGNVESVKTGTSVQIDKAAPTTTVATSPVTPNGLNGWFTTAPTVSLSAVDAASGVAQIVYHLDSDTDTVVSGNSATVSAISNGNHTLHYHSVDNAGNAESDQTLNIKVDTSNPTPSQVTSVSVDSGAARTSDKRLTVTWSAASDATSGIDHYVLKVRVGTSGSTPAIPEINVGNVTTYTLSDEQAAELTDGTYSVAIKAVDVAGNENNNKYSSGIIIDTAAPTSAAISINTGAVYTTSTAVALNLAASDGFAPIQMKLSNNPDLSADGVNVDSGSWITEAATKDWNLASGADGTRTVYVAYRDGGGNTTGTISDNIILDTTSPDAPTITPISTIQGNSVDLSGTAEHNSTINLSLTSGAVISTTANADSAGNWSKTVDISSLTDGTVTVSATATDAAGNTGSAGSITFSKDSVSPAFASIVANPIYAKVGTVVTVTFTASETLLANPGVTIGGVSASYVSKSALDYTYAYTVSGADTEGVKAISVAGTDLGGNPGTSIGSVTFDFTAPVVSNPLPSGPAGSHRPTVQATISDALSGVDASTVVMRINGIDVHAGFDLSTGIISFVPIKDIPAGTYTVVIDCKDNVGNMMTRYSFNFTISN